MENDITSLLTGELSVLLLPLLLIVRAVRKKFALSSTLPTLSEWIISGLMFVAGLGIAFANYRLAGTPAEGLVSLWWIQGLLFGGGLLVMDMGLDATSTKTESAAATIRKLGAFLAPVALASLLLSAPASAQQPDSTIFVTKESTRWDLDRLHGAISGLWCTNDDGVQSQEVYASAWLKGNLTWNLSEQLSLDAVQWLDPKSDRVRWRTVLGGHMALLGWQPGSDYYAAVGVGYVMEYGEGYEVVRDLRRAEGLAWKPNGTMTWVNLAWLVVKNSKGEGVVGGMLTANYMPVNGEKMVGAGLTASF